MVHHSVDYIIMQYNKKLGAEAEAHKNIYYKIDNNDLYEIDNMRLDKKRENTEWRKRAFEGKIKNKYDIERQNGENWIHDNEVNIIDEWNLLHDILNPTKQKEKLNSY